VRHLTVLSYNIHRGVGLDRRRDLDRIADVIGEVGIRHQLSPQVVADVGVSTSFAGRVRSTGATVGLSFDLPMQLWGGR